MPSATHCHAEQIRDLLRSGPKTAWALADALGTSQPTVSRALQALGTDVVRLGAARSIQYALRDASRADLVALIHLVTAVGQLQGLGTLVPVRPLALAIGPQVAARTWRHGLVLAQDFVGRLVGLGSKGRAHPGGFSEDFAVCTQALEAHVALAGERIGRLAG